VILRSISAPMSAQTRTRYSRSERSSRSAVATPLGSVRRLLGCRYGTRGGWTAPEAISLSSSLAAVRSASSASGRNRTFVAIRLMVPDWYRLGYIELAPTTGRRADNAGAGGPEGSAGCGLGATCRLHPGNEPSPARLRFADHARHDDRPRLHHGLEGGALLATVLRWAGAVPDLIGHRRRDGQDRQGAGRPGYLRGRYPSPL
jgi:hypothetical protein